jgi:hypothetical protein
MGRRFACQKQWASTWVSLVTREQTISRGRQVGEPARPRPELYTVIRCPLRRPLAGVRNGVTAVDYAEAAALERQRQVDGGGVTM